MCDFIVNCHFGGIILYLIHSRPLPFDPYKQMLQTHYNYSRDAKNEVEKKNVFQLEIEIVCMGSVTISIDSAKMRICWFLLCDFASIISLSVRII